MEKIIMYTWVEQDREAIGSKKAARPFVVLSAKFQTISLQ
jgi:hypothetical protein